MQDSTGVAIGCVAWGLGGLALVLWSLRAINVGQSQQELEEGAVSNLKRNTGIDLQLDR